MRYSLYPLLCAACVCKLSAAEYMDKDPFGSTCLWMSTKQGLVISRHEDVKQVRGTIYRGHSGVHAFALTSVAKSLCAPRLLNTFEPFAVVWMLLPTYADSAIGCQHHSLAVRLRGQTFRHVSGISKHCQSDGRRLAVHATTHGTCDQQGIQCTPLLKGCIIL